RLVRSLQIPCVDESKLLIWLGVFWVCLDRIFQDVDGLRKVILLYQQTGDARGELRLTRIDIEYFSIRIPLALHPAIFLKAHSFNEMCERVCFVCGLRSQREVRGRFRRNGIIVARQGFSGPSVRNFCRGSPWRLCLRNCRCDQKTKRENKLS